MTYQTRLRIKIGRHTMNKLHDLYGNDLSLEEDKLFPPYSPDEAVIAIYGQVTGGEGRGLGWSSFITKDGYHCYIPPLHEVGDGYHFGRWRNLISQSGDLLVFNEILPRLQREIDLDFSAGTYRGESITQKISDYLQKHDAVEHYSISGPFERSGYLEWEANSEDGFPHGLFKKLGNDLVDQHIEVYHMNLGNCMGGTSVINHGSLIFKEEHTSFYNPELSFALGRGLTSAEATEYLKGIEEWPFFRDYDNNEDTIQRDNIFSEILFRILLNPEIAYGMEDRWKIVTAITLLSGKCLYSEEELDTSISIQRKILSEREEKYDNFSFDALKLTIDSGLLPLDTCIGDVVDMIERKLDVKNNVSSVDIPDDVLGMP